MPNLQVFMTRQLLLAGIFAALTGHFATSATLTPDEALQRLTASDRQKAPFQISPRLISTGHFDNLTTYYVFVANERTIFVGADDLSQPLLGYIDHPVDDIGKIPPQMKWWLSEYGREITYANKTTQTPTIDHTSNDPDTKSAIAPLVKTRWDQSAPYNDLCPESDGKRSYTGCVATAMAQAMKYFNWPEKGTGTLSYTWSGEQMSMNLDSVNLEWDQMIDTYSAAAPGTEQQRLAVATLMKACGYSVNMNYGSSTAGSGASPFSIVPALVGHFGYDKATELHMRDFYPLDQWEDMIYQNLATIGPVIYGGESQEGGHCFICDGYDTDGFFHINWGWSGDYDGYFRLSALNPAGQGAGGSAGGYNSAQDAVLGMRKPQAGSSYPDPYLALQGSLVGEVEGDMLVLGAGYQGGFFNLSSYPGSFDIGLEVKNNETGETIYQTAVKGEEIASMAGLVKLEYPLPNGLVYGTYSATPVYKVNGSDWTPFKIPQSSPTHVTLVVDSNGISVDSSGQISVESFTTPDGFNIGQTSTVIATIDNTFDEMREVQISLYLCQLVNETTLSPVISYGTETLDVAARGASTVTFSTLIPGDTPSGDYYVVFTDAAGKVISEPELVNLQLPSGISEIDDNNANTTTEYYTLQGIRVEKTDMIPGVYIKVSGGRSSKVVVR